MTDDAALLRSYVQDRSETAFAELVRRHLNLVYFAALRRTGGDAALAEDITQGVFTALAREAAALTPHPALTGWLYTATRNVALKAIRAEQRRRTREEEAHRMNELSSEPAGSPDWARLRPLLDAAIDDLSDRDREAVLWRCWEGRAYAEIAAALRVSEDAARMRVERALEKLRGRLAKRGLTSTAVALAAALSGQAALAAPSGLAAGVTSGALLAAGTGTAAIWAPVMQFMANSKLLAGAAVALTVAAIGTATQEAALRRTVETSLAAVGQSYDAHLAQQREVEHQMRTVEQMKGELAKKVEEAKVAAAAVKAASRGIAPAVKAGPPDPSAEGKLFLERHPEAQALLIEWGDAQANGEWGPFMSALGLSPAQADAFRLLVRDRSFMPGLGDDGKELNLIVGPRLSLRETKRRLQTLLGDEGYAKYEEYKNTLPARGLVDKVASALCFSETPLAVTQSQALMQIMERHRLPGVIPPAARFDWDGVIAQAGAVLSPPQVAVLTGMKVEDQYQQAVDRLAMLPKSKR